MGCPIVLELMYPNPTLQDASPVPPDIYIILIELISKPGREVKVEIPGGMVAMAP
ncbi:hypothetical protein D3C87_1780320 [compost metagenome]